MERISFNNGYQAEYSNGVIRLYANKDMFLCSMPGAKDRWAEKAEAMMYGFFAGWDEHRRVMREKEEGILALDISEAYRGRPKY